MGWMREKKLKLNPDKTEVFLVRQNWAWDKACCGWSCIPQKEQVHRDCHLNPSDHGFVDRNCSNKCICTQPLWAIQTWQQSFLPCFWLDYCNVLYSKMNLPLRKAQKYSWCRNLVARLLLSPRYKVHMLSGFKDSHWSPYQGQFNKLMLIMTVLNCQIICGTTTVVSVWYQ